MTTALYTRIFVERQREGFCVRVNTTKSCIVCTFQKAIFTFIVIFCFHVCLLVYTKSFNLFLPLNWDAH